MKIYPEGWLPFDFTPHIFRYLESLIEINDSTFAESTGDEISIDNYITGEHKSPEIQLNNGAFWSYLQSERAIDISREKSFEGLKPGMTIEGEIVESGGNRTIYLAKTYLKIIDIKIIKELLKERGKRIKINPKTLELISKEIAEHKSGTEIIQLLGECGVPKKIIVYPETKWKMLVKTFRVLNTSLNQRANRMLYKIIENSIHPLFFEGDEEKTGQVREKYNTWLKYDNVQISKDDGKIYIGPTKEERDMGFDDWFSSDGETYEPTGHVISPDDVAKLWVLWSQLVQVVSAHQKDTQLNNNELEKLYLEIIGKAEEIIFWGEVGTIKEKYKRPFTSLSTAEIETKAKGMNRPMELVGNFLIEITSLNPYPPKVSKETEEQDELIKRVLLATKVSTHVESMNLPSLQQNAPTDKTIKIEITKMPTVKTYIEKQQTQFGEFPYKIPSGTTWENIIFQFTSEDFVTISVAGHSHQTGYADMGFVDSRTGKPNFQWALLLVLSKNNGLLEPSSSDAKDKYKKQKQLLSERLKKYFSIEYDPFEPYKRGYKIKMTITPPTIAPQQNNQVNEVDEIFSELSGG